MIHTKLMPNIPNGSTESKDFAVFLFFSNASHLEFFMRLTLKTFSLVTLNTNFENLSQQAHDVKRRPTCIYVDAT